MKKLLLTMTILTGFATMQAYNFSDMWEDFKNTGIALGNATKDTVVDGAKLIKENTWDLKIGSCENGGKVVCCTLAAIIAIDEAYCWYVNRQIMEEFNARKQLAKKTDSDNKNPNKPVKKSLKKRGA